jgi:hypothetical protein
MPNHFTDIIRTVIKPAEYASEVQASDTDKDLALT